MALERACKHTARLRERGGISPEVGSTGEVRPTFSLRAARTLIAPAALCRPWWECLFPASKCNDLRRPTVPEGRTPTVLPHHTDPRRQLLQQYQYTSTLAWLLRIKPRLCCGGPTFSVLVIYVYVRYMFVYLTRV